MSNTFKKTSNFSIAFMTDWHIGTSANTGKAATLITWVTGYQPRPVAMVIGGDINVTGSSFSSVLQDWLDAAGWDNNIEILPVIGNHDTLYPINAGAYPFASGEHPHGGIVATFPSKFNGNLYYSWEYEAIKFISLCNVCDTSGNDYHNCNPPGYLSSGIPNPDYSGFQTPGSAQWNFAIDECSNFDGTWLIAGIHRPMYSAYPHTGVGRPTMYEGRSTLLKTMIDSGLSILLQGDQHVHFVGTKYRSDDGDHQADIKVVDSVTGVGVWPFVLAGAYATNRPVFLEEIPNSHTLGVDYIFASGTSSPVLSYASALVLTFYGNAAYFEMAECRGDEGPVYLVASGTIWRNLGVNN